MKARPTHLLAALFLLTPGVSAPVFAKADKGEETTESATVSKVYTSSETAPFKDLAQATLKALSAGNKEEMVTKLTDLETAWDDQEKSLKPRDEATWTTIDKTLDKAISALRSSKYNEKKGEKALQSLQGLLDQATK